MNMDMDKAFDAVGSKNRYQIFHFFAVCLVWFSVDFVAICFPLLLHNPKSFCRDADGINFSRCETDEIMCERFAKNQDDVKFDVIYTNLIQSKGLLCNKSKIDSVSILFTLGVIVGAFVASKLSDSIGRKSVCLGSLVSFGGCTALYIWFNNDWTNYLSLLLMGMGSSGGTMTSFVLIYEVIHKDSRNMYGTLINSSYAIAGCLYYTVYIYTENWQWAGVLSLSASFLGMVWLAISFVESPRYLIGAHKYKQCLIAFLRIANKNGLTQQYFQYLKEEVLTPTHISSIDQSLLYESHISFGRLKKLILTLDYNVFEKIPKIEQTPEGSTVESIETNQIEENLIEEGALDIHENLRTPGITALCKYKSVRNTFLYCSLIWITVAYAYFGNSYIQKETIETLFSHGFTMFGAEFTAYLLSGVIMQIPFMGRTRTVGYGGLLSAILAVPLVWLSHTSPYDLILLFVYRFAITCVFTGMYTYVTEVYPTSIRSLGMGINLFFARLATIIVALTVTSFQAYWAFCVIGILVFVVHSQLKETFGKPLEDEIEELRTTSQVNEKIVLEDVKDKTSVTDN